MANLYLWFNSTTERREFVKKLLGIEPIKPPYFTAKAHKKANQRRESLKLYLDSIDAGKTASPYYNLGDCFPFGKVPETKKELEPWDELAVFKKGIRRLYTQNSYEYRPGNWLVIQFRDTNKAWELRQWVEAQIPKEHQGLNVPVPQEQLDIWALIRIKQCIDAHQNNAPFKPKLEKIEYSMRQVLNISPQLYKGGDIYLWEELAILYSNQGQIEKAVACLKVQAQLQPNKSDAYLNMGVFLSWTGYYHRALSAYTKGLDITPSCEYLLFNLAVLMDELHNPKEALKTVNEALLANPNSPATHKLKADIMLKRGKPEAAYLSYQQAFNSLSDNRSGLAILILQQLLALEIERGNHYQALDWAVLLVAAGGANKSTYRRLSNCFQEFGDTAFADWFQQLASKASTSTKELKDKKAHVYDIRPRKPKYTVLELREKLIKYVMEERGWEREQAEHMVDCLY